MIYRTLAYEVQCEKCKFKVETDTYDEALKEGDRFIQQGHISIAIVRLKRMLVYRMKPPKKEIQQLLKLKPSPKLN